MCYDRTERISSLVRLLAESLEARPTADHPQVGAALREFGKLARLQIPAHGVLPLSNDQVFDAIDSVAIKHLNLKSARGARRGLGANRATSVARRDRSGG